MSRVFAGVVAPVRQLLSGRGMPSIHDITTDPDDPPEFSAVLPLRTGNVSPPGYDGRDTAAQQRRAYPDIRPLELDVTPARALDESAAVARQLGWDVVAVDRARGVLEAVDTTFWFRFTDDIVVRVRESAFRLEPEATGTGTAVASGFRGTNPGSRVDVRSKSRVGRGDLGANARRIRMFLAALRARLAP
ncbi:MAG TPA: DUF1499 domain-containing protein [Vicinamibacterales bacterium]